MSTTSRRVWFGRFLLIGGISWIVFGLSHLLFPTLLNWDTVLSNIPPGHLLGMPLSNRGFIYLFNADLLLYDIFFGVLSLLLVPCAPRATHCRPIWHRHEDLFCHSRRPADRLFRHRADGYFAGVGLPRLCGHLPLPAHRP
jgi:hypothetical protein